MTEPTKAKEAKVKSMAAIKAAYDKAVEEGLVTTRPVILNKPKMGEPVKEEEVDDEH